MGRAGIIALLGVLCLWSNCRSPEDLDLSPRVILIPEGPSKYLTTSDTLKLRIRLTALDGFQFFRVQEVNTGVLLNLTSEDFPDQAVLDSLFLFPMDSYDVRDTLLYEFLLADGKNRTGSNKLQVIISKPVDSIYLSFTTPYETSFPSFFSASQWTAYDLEEATSNYLYTDLGFDTIFNGWFVSSPADSFFSQIWVPELSTWPSRNGTLLFSTNQSREQFTVLENDGPILESFINPVLSIDSLDEGDVIAFLTVDTLAGWMLIDEIQSDFGNDKFPYREVLKVSFKVSR